jgi:NAD(P)-dependent dehydrogenase (short-subunit alcohol dehydrogenase family)
MDLAGKVVVVPVEWTGTAALAMAMAARGATVVLVGPDGDAAGRLAAEVEAAGVGRPAVFVARSGRDDLDALAAYLSELFRPS